MTYWQIIELQIKQLCSAQNADDVMSILSVDGRTGNAGFFGGSGGDYAVDEALSTAGWTYLWAEASYHWAMRSPDGKSAISYVEGDVFRGNSKPLPRNEKSA